MQYFIDPAVLLTSIMTKNVIAVVVFSYFLYALASVMDKHIVSNTALKPISYAFYSGFFQIFYIVAVPIVAFATPQITLTFPPSWVFLLAVLDGIVYIAALVSLYKATAADEVSRITPMVGVLVPVFTFFLSAIFLKEALSSNQLIAFFFFVSAGFLMSARISKKGFSYVKGMDSAILAGFLFAVYYVLMSFLFKNGGFIEIYTILQLGGFIGALLLLLSKNNRKVIFEKKQAAPVKEKNAYGIITFFADKGVSALGAILLSFAISFSSVTIINSLQAVQYAFVLIFAIILSHKMPHFFDEQINKHVILQKSAALVLTAIGLWLIA
jgi:drug/metabolite transporter (DMT)-like permease